MAAIQSTTPRSSFIGLISRIACPKSAAWLIATGLMLLSPLRAIGQDCNNNGIPDFDEIQGAHASLDFDGSDDYVRIPRSPTIEPANEMTFEAWVRADSAGPSNSMICRISGNFGAGYILAWQWSSGGRIQLRIDFATGGSRIVTDTTPTSSYVNQWVHVAFTYSVSSNSVVLYVNGIAKASAAAVGPLLYSNSDLYIGNSLFGSSDDFDGRIDEIRLWNAARTPSQIAADMSHRLPATQPGLIGYWRFNEGTGQSVADATSNANHGFRGASAATESTDPAWSLTGAPLQTNDCNNNGVLDECDIASGSPDCNSNQIPDTCDLASAVMADSVADFSAVQGSHNWYYGYYVAPYTSSTFQLLNQYGPDSDFSNINTWHLQKGSGGFFTAIGQTQVHPNGPVSTNGRQNVGHWVCRRWISDRSGPVQLSGHVAKLSAQGCGGCDGEHARVFVDGVQIWNQFIAQTDSVGVAFNLAATLNVGSTVDFVIDPLGNDGQDFSLLTATIRGGDCNNNGILDSCDILASPESDCNADGILDVCQSSADCNNNGIRDFCDIAAGTSTDCDINGVPDACQLASGAPDCNANQIIDSCDIGAGNRALRFDGIDDLVLMPQSMLANVTTLTFEAWFRTPGSGVIFGYQNSAYPGGPSSWMPVVYVGLDGKLRGKFYNNQTPIIASTTTVNDNNWHHVALVGAINTQNMYLDGVLVSGSPMTGNIGHSGLIHSQLGNGWAGGIWPSSNNAFPFVGEIDHVRFWNVARTQTQIVADMNKSYLGPKAGLLTYLRMDTGTGQSVLDSSGNLYHGTLGTSVAADNFDPVWVAALDATPASGDCNGNGVPDACDADCNNNGVVDVCEIDLGSIQDCNGNGIPDSCDVLGGATDCDANGVPDSCDVVASYQRVYFVGSARAWPTEHGGFPPANCVDGNTATYTWSTAGSNFQNPSFLGVQFAGTITVDGIRLWKDNDGGGGASVKNLTIQYTTDASPNVGGGTWQNVSGMSNGYLGGELLQCTTFNANGTVIGDIHDSVNDGHGWATLRFDRITATGVRIGFSTADASTNHYKVHEFQLFKINTTIDCNNNNIPDTCDIATGVVSDCNENGIADDCELAGPLQIPGVVVSPLNGRLYKLTAPKTWLAAEAEAVSLGGHLATVRDAAENQWILDFVLANSSDNRAWIGFNDQAVEGTHVWTSGETPGYTNWYPGEPNNSGNEDATEMLCTVFTPGTWNDTPGTESHVGVMEFGPVTDCNNNGVLDACELVGNDCDANGVPDECQPDTDCDNNGIRDLCEEAGRADCDGDGATNYCEVAAGALDCDSDWIPDNCESKAGNSALAFDGSNDIVRVPRSATLEPTNELTVECWVRANSAGASHSRLVRMTGNRGYILAWQGSGDQRVQLQIISATSGTVIAKDTVPTSTYFGEWHHIAATYSASGNFVRLYVDGELKDSKNAVGPLLYSNVDLHMGNSIYGSETFNGQIDELRIWTVARTQAQIAASMNVSLSGPQAGLVGYWKMDGGAGQSVVDSSGRGNHGQRGNDTIPTGDAADPAWVQVIGDLPGPADCNGNQIPDVCEIASATVTDCNNNSVPDSCESDCNSNGIADACDISAGTVPDCNGNAIPDACDIAAGTSTDVNANGVPDACEPDIRVIPVISIIDPVNSSEIRSTQPASIAAVSRGTRYFIEVWASDVGSTNTGLTGVYTDVNFCGQTTATAVAHGGIFTVFPAGTIQSGKVDEFGGSALPNGGGIAPQWVRVGWIEMNAGTESPGCSISLSPATGGIAAFNRGLINNALITFGSISLAITPPAKSYDLDDNNTINVGDLSLFAASWLQTVPPGDTDHDFDCDDAVGVSDLSWFATGWLKSVTDPTILYPACNGGGGWGPGDEPGDEPTDVAFRIAVLSTPSSSDNRITVPNSITTINEGQQYYVEVWASDVGDINTGITSAYLDLMLPPTAAAVISINHNGIFTVFPSGAEDEGRIDELGGSHLNADAGASPIWSRVATVRLFADVHRPVKVFSLTPSTTGVAAYGRGSVSWNAISLDTLSIGTPGPGDIDADGDVDHADLPLFVNVLLGANTDPGHIARSDLNADTLADGRDIAGFVGVLTGG